MGEEGEQITMETGMQCRTVGMEWGMAWGRGDGGMTISY